MALAMAMMLPGGRELKDLFAPAEWPTIDSTLQQQLGAMAAMTGRMKPFYVMALLLQAETATQTTADEASKGVLDGWLQTEARDSGITVMGLESVGEQLAAIDRIPLKEQADMLREMVVGQKNGSAVSMEDMVDAYVLEDLNALSELLAEGGLPEATNEALLLDRNTRMAQRMDSLIRAGHACFFAVGAAHLPGDQGVIELMRQRKWTVEPVNDARTDAWVEFVNDSVGFRVSMPAQPGKLVRDDRSTGGGCVINWNTKTTSGEALAIMAMDIPLEHQPVSNDSLLSRIARGKPHLPGTIISKEAGTVAGKERADMVVYIAKEERTDHYRLIRCSASRAIILWVSPANAPMGDRFFSSFSLLP